MRFEPIRVSCAITAIAWCTAWAAGARAESVGAPPPLPAPTGTVVRVATETELQTAVKNLVSNTTILIAPGTYRLTSSLYIGNRTLTDIALRGATDNRNDVVLLGPGMRNASYGSTPYGIWMGNGVQRVLVANMTIRDFYFHPVILNYGVQSARFHNVRLTDGGQQLLKSNPGSSGLGNDFGIVEYSVLDYTDTSRDYYTNAVDVHGGAGWIIRHNLFRNIRAPLGQLAGPAILMWRGSRDTTVDGNTFVNCQRDIALGLAAQTPNDHTGGIIRNNFIYRDSSVAGDVGIGVFDSPNTAVVHNTIFTAGTYPNAIEYRFADTTGVVIANNLVNRAIVARDGATATVQNNITTATLSMFVNAVAGDLHLLSTAMAAIDKGIALANSSRDWDGQARPYGAAADIGADELASAAAPAPDPTPNVPPVVALTAPTSGATISSRDPTALAAAASDSDGTVKQVAFYANGALVGTDTTAPYSVTWTGMSQGSYTLTAIATDNAGASTTSAPIRVTICNRRRCR